MDIQYIYIHMYTYNLYIYVYICIYVHIYKSIYTYIYICVYFAGSYFRTVLRNLITEIMLWNLITKLDYRIMLRNHLATTKRPCLSKFTASEDLDRSIWIFLAIVKWFVCLTILTRKHNPAAAIKSNKNNKVCCSSLKSNIFIKVKTPPAL